MATPLPTLEQFRLEMQPNGLAHLVFDCPGRTMNVFSNAAIHELGEVAAWLAAADVKGLLLRSGKDNAFCAGADLTELGVAYDMIMQAAPQARFNVAFDHFFPLSKAIRALETAGKPVAAAIAGLALGGGCELALGAHYRVLVDDPKIAMGLPESLVGLLPGAGGTQRLPRLIGLEAALPILLEGGRLSGQAALEVGLVHALAQPGEDIAMAEAWLLATDQACQPWDAPDWRAMTPGEIDPLIAPRRASADVHYPAPIAILDCLQFGLPQCFEGAIRSEMAIFAGLIQRPEPRNMIQTLFLGKNDYDRLKRKDALPAFVAEIVAAVAAISGDRNDAQVLTAISKAVEPWRSQLGFEQRRLVDYATVRDTGYPAYLGGPFTFGERGFA
ncbi:enoyl-CoA hydratase-related protein [Aquisediminimonas sediminicola]|uniref:enoyl-CoA hydratase-related protein n=1 Tax=Alteraquisediminimonas sediminicola TaxID=2676787 RepID=UPI001C8F02B8|nr:enoyl-CoA hydratase-related protein [Aquisediminimonas sediminicola]